MPASASRISPELVVGAGCLIALITFGPRAAAGLFQLPMVAEYGWGREVFSLAIAIQNLLWGVGARSRARLLTVSAWSGCCALER